MSVLDLERLGWRFGPRVNLFGHKRLTALSDPSDPVEGFEDVESLILGATVNAMGGTSPQLSLQFEQRDTDEDEWEPLSDPMVFTSPGQQAVRVDAPKDQIRVVPTVTGTGTPRVTVGAVAVVPTGEWAAESGGSQPVVLKEVVDLLAVDLNQLDTTPITIIPAPDAGYAAFPTAFFLEGGAGDPYSAGAGSVFLHVADQDVNDSSYQFGEDLFGNVSPGTTGGFFAQNATAPAFPAAADLDGKAWVIEATDTLSEGTADYRLTILYALVPLIGTTP